ncbi:phosphoribosyl-AMP cyclohydrolase [Pseudolactococcus insecticola]|uniref:Phosphoribosyl-AMP cyclohydrolase n=1 Tax=Pseudolactococcus insecticola TaxID=2709158 RepID=A0A6A0B7S2_9LACT|nr:phosphoribosyl-AMP cyclohydrolase [Lactococcus insecticola]GFH41342.1 phosphoribosyl-AMP cyclohydrolase [Lactococcus insecticola]
MTKEQLTPDFSKSPDGLIPAIITDVENGQVLMLAYMNAESYQLTLETGETYYWSRSRSELWHKGETSGHFQHVKKIALDCDLDTILIAVEQIGPACHTGARSCFFNDVDLINTKEEK